MSNLTRFLAAIYKAASLNPDNKLFGSDTKIMTFTVGGEKIILNEFPLQFINAQTDFSGNPPYPKARAGNIYVAKQSGEVGQVNSAAGTGKFLAEGDILLCLLNSETGDESTVGANWIVIGNAGSGSITSKALSQVDQTSNPAGSSYGLIEGDVDGANDTFVVSKKNYISGTLVVFYGITGAADGRTMFQKIDWEETNPTTGEFKFLFIPANGSSILAMYAYKNFRIGSFDDSFDDSFDN